MHTFLTFLNCQMPIIKRCFSNGGALSRHGFIEEKSVANSLLKKLAQISTQVVQDIVDDSDQEVGGITTTTILARALVNESNQFISKGADPKEIRVGIMAAVEMVIKQLNAMARPINRPEQLLRVAITSAQGDRAIGGLIYQTINTIGLDGQICIRNANTIDVELRFCDAIKFRQSYISPSFINTPSRSLVEFDSALLFICRNTLTRAESIVRAMELAELKRMPLLIIAKDIVDEALNHLILQRINANAKVAAVKAPCLGRWGLTDIAMASGGAVFPKNNEPEPEPATINIYNLGQVGYVTITKEDTLLIQGYGDEKAIVDRIDAIEKEIRWSSSQSQKKILEERMALLDTRVAVFLVGGSSEGDKEKKKALIANAVRITNAAVEGGLVPGGGTALIRCMEHLESLIVENKDQSLGVDTVRRALRMPCWTIAQNAGLDGDEVVYIVETAPMYEDFGYDVVSGKYGSMSMKGIMDPTKVVCTAITNAAGMASLLITDHEYMISNK
ncbi:heat shock protein 60A-like isoform X1 [Drosophila pseudoobscura]|uniref:Heat shock protein 60A-like isoform X1 n=2 Tax=Drosophila pseudoobscura pseudoobscura TaxID=46245 RepID=A0A6I8V060_DROPS|nr:heat shock protein 60A isoform X1 [Drosophila pseudoobscura]